MARHYDQPPGGIHVTSTAEAKPRLASVSLDLDNRWSYMKTHGDADWEKFPSYLEVCVPRFLEFFKTRGWKITVFVVGQDAARPESRDVLRSIAEAGHEIGNHSFHHEPWLHLYDDKKLDRELRTAHDTIAETTGYVPTGFRGPGYSFSTSVLRWLTANGYDYDASTFPTFIGPLARLYYFMASRLSKEQKQERKLLFGSVAEGLRPVGPYYWRDGGQRLLEIPVTTMPFVKAPIHLSYLLYLQQYSQAAALAYFRLALTLCSLGGVEPSILLHPLDFLGRDDNVGLDFFPAMRVDAQRKVDLVAASLEMLAAGRQIVPMKEHAAVCHSRRLREIAVPSSPSQSNRTDHSMMESTSHG